MESFVKIGEEEERRKKKKNDLRGEGREQKTHFRGRTIRVLPIFLLGEEILKKGRKRKKEDIRRLVSKEKEKKKSESESEEFYISDSLTGRISP